jgi:hypothetical protein
MSLMLANAAVSLSHANITKPRVYKLGPRSYRQLGATETERVASLRIQVHFYRNSRFP